jgi:hypothetical protein
MPLPDALRLKIAAEMNLAETAFLEPVSRQTWSHLLFMPMLRCLDHISIKSNACCMPDSTQWSCACQNCTHPHALADQPHRSTCNLAQPCTYGTTALQLASDTRSNLCKQATFHNSAVQSTCCLTTCNMPHTTNAAGHLRSRAIPQHQSLQDPLVHPHHRGAAVWTRHVSISSSGVPRWPPPSGWLCAVHAVSNAMPTAALHCTVSALPQQQQPQSHSYTTVVWRCRLAVTSPCRLPMFHTSMPLRSS